MPACECLRTLDAIGAGGLAMSAKFTPRASNRPQSDPDSRVQALPRQGADCCICSGVCGVRPPLLRPPTPSARPRFLTPWGRFLTPPPAPVHEPPCSSR